jgi:hypothetical protein
MMQKVEAHFVYDRICTRIEAERPQGRITMRTL